MVVLATFAIAAVLTLLSGVPHSAAQTGTGYGAPQSVPDQLINGTGKPASHVGLYAGSGLAVVVLGGAALLGWQHHRHTAPYA